MSAAELGTGASGGPGQNPKKYSFNRADLVIALAVGIIMASISLTYHEQGLSAVVTQFLLLMLLFLCGLWVGLK